MARSPAAAARSDRPTRIGRRPPVLPLAVAGSSRRGTARAATMTHRAPSTGAPWIGGTVGVAVREPHAGVETGCLAPVQSSAGAVEHVRRGDAEVLDAVLARQLDELVPRRERLDTAHRASKATGARRALRPRAGIAGPGSSRPEQAGAPPVPRRRRASVARVARRRRAASSSRRSRCTWAWTASRSRRTR